jgi:peptide-methionine (R)-S-oxide reductase
MKMKKYTIEKSEDEWKKQLSEDQYRILRKKGTEAPHTGKYNLHFEDGQYKCAACDNVLFDSQAKFESNCGWPSFDESVEGSIEYVKDKTFGMIRTEILCSNCGGHIGHVFDDGPTETGQRYCVNSASIDFN